MQFILAYWPLWLILMLIFMGYAIYNRIRAFGNAVTAFLESDAYVHSANVAIVVEEERVPFIAALLCALLFAIPLAIALVIKFGFIAIT